MDLLATTSAVVVSSYALLSTVYKSVQALYAQPVKTSSLHENLGRTELALPSVDVIVPCFNEDPNTLSKCLESIASQDYAGKLLVYVVDDGSKNRDVVGPVHNIYANDPRFSIILLARNVGKRKAQIAAIRSSSGDLVLNVDSDTTLAADVVTKLVSKMQDPETCAAMGQLIACNRSENWLTRLIDMEYWLACNEERAAQARFGAVMCCCGPCAMYRRSALDLLLDQYESQFFRGKPSDFGEDRHLTILMLKAGFRTEYVPDAIAATVVPNSLGPYLRQQLRWARSTFRDTFLAAGLLPELDSYLTLDVIGQNLGPLLLGLSALTAIVQFVIGGSVPWWTLLMISAMTMVRCSVAAFRAREVRFIGFSLHTPINMFLIIPLKAYALCTLSNSDWLSRKLVELPTKENKQVAIPRPNAAALAARGGGVPEAIRRRSSRGSSAVPATDGACGRD